MNEGCARRCWCMAGPKTGRRSAGRTGSTMSARAGACCCCRTRLRSGRGALRRGLEAAAGGTRRFSEPARHLQSRRRRRCADGGQVAARCAAGARRGRRPDRTDDGICRAACADASPPGPLYAGVPARKTLGAAIAMGRQARLPSASWGSARWARMPPTRCGGSAFASSAGAAAPKQIDGIECFHGARAIGAVPAPTDILVCLLPLTPDTRHVLNRDLFAKLNRTSPLGAPVLINAGRGGLQNEADILQMPRRRHARRRLARRLRHRTAATGQPVLEPSRRWC